MRPSVGLQKKTSAAFVVSAIFYMALCMLTMFFEKTRGAQGIFLESTKNNCNPSTIHRCHPALIHDLIYALSLLPVPTFGDLLLLPNGSFASGGRAVLDIPRGTVKTNVLKDERIEAFAAAWGPD